MAKQKFLIVDDSRMIRMRIKDMLPSSNVDIIEAKDGREGLEKIRSESPDLIMLDFLLPKLSGWQVYQEIQNDPQLKAIPLVLMSGRKEEVTENIPEPFEDFAFIEKPFEPEQLINAIEDAQLKARTRQTFAASAPAANVEVAGAPSADVAALEAKVAALSEQVEAMQGQIETLNKQMSQIVGFIKKKLG